MVYAGDYHAVGELDPRWIPDYAAVEAAIADAKKLTHYSNELPAVTDGVAAVAALANLGTNLTNKVANVEVYLNGAAQVPGGADYTLNALTGVITFASVRSTGDIVLVHYDKQDA